MFDTPTVKFVPSLLVCLVPTQVRLALGAAEAGFAPGCLLYLAYFYKKEELGARNAAFLVSGALASALGAILAYGVLRMDGVRGLSGWRWLFILEGLPPLVLGLMVCGSVCGVCVVVRVVVCVALCMCVCVCVWLAVCVALCVYVCVVVCVVGCVFGCVCVVCVCVCMCVWLCVWLCFVYVCGCVCVALCVWLCVWLCAPVHGFANVSPRVLVDVRIGMLWLHHVCECCTFIV